MTPELTGPQFEQLTEALKSAFPKKVQLRMMVRVGLGKNLNDFADLSNLENAAFDLIEKAESEGWTEKLVRAAHGRNPGNRLLCAVVEELGISGPVPQPTTSAVAKQSHEICLPHNFDLIPLTREILNHFPDQGLAGFAVPYNSDSFLVCLAERLRHEMGRDWTYSHSVSLKVDSMRAPLEAVIRTIKAQAAGRLPTHHVIFTVWGLNRASQTAAFWQALAEAVSDVTMEHSLIVILGLDAAQNLPDEILLLPEPCFEKADLRSWISAVIDTYGWPSDAIPIWYERFWHTTSYNDLLIIELVYEHLLFVQKHLQSAHSWQQFDQALQEWSQNYA